MKESIIHWRNKIISYLYRRILKPILFLMDPEFVHDRFVFFGRILGSNPFTRSLVNIKFGYGHPMLKQNVAGIEFANPVGLAAGFDKNAHLPMVLSALGMGFEEVGSITGEACTGNDGIRLWRHPENKSLRIYYGLMNDGAEEIARRLSQEKFRFPVGISIAKTNCQATADNEVAIKDYVKTYRAFEHIGDYITINISCPNAYGGQPFTDRDKLDRLFAGIEQVRYSKPIFIKLSPDLSERELDDIIAVAEKYKLSGFVSANLTKKHDYEKGGLSGGAVKDLATRQIGYIYKKTGGKFIIMGCGGVFTAADAYEKIKAGASLIQMITGMIYEGPQVISQINQGLVQLLKKDGYQNIKEAIGADYR